MSDWRDTLRNPHCEICPLHEGAEFVCLMGSGPKRSDILIVGEAPGQREDEEHRAFTGKAGQLLDLALEQYANINRDDCHVTNVVKCRPKNNKTPDRKNVKACVESYFWDEIAHVKPKFVLLLGNSALQGVMKLSGIMKKAGSVWPKVLGGVPVEVMATIHPAAVLRNPKNADLFTADIARFGRLVRGQKQESDTKVKIIRTVPQLRWLISELEQASVISYDIETYTKPAKPPYVHTNFQDWHYSDSCIVSIGFSWNEGRAAVVPLWHVKTPWKDPDSALAALRPVLTRKDCKYIAHNGKFDARWLHSKGIPVEQTFDTMLSAHMLEENRPKGLKPLSRVILGVDAYDVGEELDAPHKVPLRRLCVYNGKDSDYTLRLYRAFKEQLKQDERTARLFIKLMMPASNALVDIERHGVWIDPDRWQERHDQAQENVSKLYRYINRFVSPELRPINLRSPPQVAKWLYGDLGLPVLEKTETGNPTTKEGIILRLMLDHDEPGLKALLKYRKWAKYLSTYLLPWWYEHRDDRGRIHSNYKLFGTVTGRLSGEGGIQQVPRDPFIRSIIGAPPGYVFLQADYSQIELRIAAMQAKERTMLSQFSKGEDIHWRTALRDTDKQRTLRDAEMHALRCGLPTNRASAEVLSSLWRTAPSGTQPEEILQACRKDWADQKSRSRQRRQSTGCPQSILEGRNISPLLQKASKDFLRILRQQALPMLSPQGLEPTKQSGFEYRDAVSILSQAGARFANVEKEWKELRKKAKATSFGFIYGMGAGKFVNYAFENYEVKITQQEAERIRDNFFREYSALKTWHDRQRRLARRYGMVYSPIGRARHLPDIMSADKDVQAEAERQAINSPVQSMASDMMLTSLVRLHRRMNPDECAIVGTVHDSILFEVREDVVDEYAALIKETMENIEYIERLYNCDISVPIIADVEIGTHWAEGKPWEPKEDLKLAA